MRAAIFYGGKDIRVEDVPDPAPGDGEVLVRIGAAGVCGSDLHPYRGAPMPPSAIPWPRRSGHELAGTVVALGAGVTSVGVGQRVAVEPMHLVGCGACSACRRGDYHVCPTRGVRNGERRFSGGFSELDTVVAENVYPLPDHVSVDEASLLDVYGCGVHAIHRVPFRASDYVGVVGTGPIGMTMGQVARAAGARAVIMIGRRDALLRTALDVGAADLVVNNTAGSSVAEEIADLTGGAGCAVVYESVGGQAETVAQSIEAASFGGRVGIIGAFWGDLPIPSRAAMAKEVDLRWCNSYASWEGERELQIALDMLAAGRLNARPLITHRFPLTEIAQAFEAADDKRASGALKVIVQP
ncbi:MAG: alcohol dehydrogenase catalytic domain-containing protein [Chloroflexota bacterium]